MFITTLWLSLAGQMQPIDAGEYRPLYLKADTPYVQVQPFQLDAAPVTNQAYFEFVQAQTKWQKQNVPSIFAEHNYLQHWLLQNGQYQPSQHQLNTPVTNVSWFAAQAYCQAQGKVLPTVDQWEYVALASEHQANGSIEDDFHQKILAWYSKPTPTQLPEIMQNPANYWGVYDMHGLVWEWTLDFNSALVNGESRNDASLDAKLFCGAGAAKSADPKDYAAFMRFGFRSSLQAHFTSSNLGFRCAAATNYSKD